MLGFDTKHISASDQDASPALAQMKAAVENAKENNPFVVYEATGHDLVYAIFDIAKNDEGVHLEKALGIVGALAGYSCAMSAGLTAEQQDAPKDPAAHAKRIDHLVFGSNSSLYRVWQSKAVFLGETKTLDFQELVSRHNAQIGTPEFGTAKLPQGRFVEEKPITLLLDHWKDMIGILNRYDEHYAGWPISWAAAGAQLMEMGQSAIPAGEALQILLEYAVPMSRVGAADTNSKPEAA
ncbi:hypothetical protein SAMN05444003_1039 [Cognatiyoonia sediminum]|uniref:Uncharacterized protein n=2 Tax=Cognatiyoonia sediminum TaxID=1508389 RepID=A0A1M5MV47_9RHOB|nr:hypothetical protein SAMN05444003_1039 [Cognatiyoonia sediminum]